MSLKIGELFIQLGVKGDTKELDKSIKQMEEAQKKNKELLKYRQDLAKATTQSEKALIKKNFADKIQLENLKKQSATINQQNANWVGLAKGVLGFITAATLAYKAMDRLITSFASANQQMITFQRTTGLSFASLNKYASANAAVNFNSSIEGTAQTMSRLASNLFDIRMGRGDISPYQELAFVGGKAFNPMGMSVEQVIESVREAIKGVDDLQATNIIQRMGFAPDDLLMLRMSREEFEKINDLFLSPEQREAMNKYALELKKINLQFQKTGQSILIDFAEPFIKLSRIIERIWNAIYKTIIKPIVLGFKIIAESIKGIVKFSQDLTRALANTFEILKPILAVFRGIYLIFQDIATYFSGGESYFGDFIEGISKAADMFKTSEIGKFFDTIEEKVNKISNLNWDWLDKLNRWVAMNIFRDRDKFKELGYSDKQINQIIDTGAIPPVNTNQISQANTNNINTNNQFTINSNQPTEIIAQGLIDKFTPAQIQFSAITA